ncbi:hypothetical protein, partial [Mesorhizobium sp.]|uniref:hypothetical protein n=1 Tax=Mesorhizobium sp. TaxID=1871066 RepID=UPI0025C11099
THSFISLLSAMFEETLPFSSCLGSREAQFLDAVRVYLETVPIGTEEGRHTILRDDLERFGAAFLPGGREQNQSTLAQHYRNRYRQYGGRGKRRRVDHCWR